jgi:hypothetical protein
MQHGLMRWFGAATLLAITGMSSSAAFAITYVFNNIDFPGAAFTAPVGINNLGQVVGVYGPGPGLAGTSPFLYDPLSTGPLFSNLPAPPAGFSTYIPYGINDSGFIVGQAANYAANGVASGQGFCLSGSNYTLVPGSVAQPNIAFFGVNSAGLIAGYQYTTNAQNNGVTGGVGLIYDPASGNSTTFSVPGRPRTIASSINSAGDVVGYGNGGLAYLRDPTGTLTTFQLNGGAATFAESINNNGLIAGEVGGTPTGQNWAFVGNSSGYQIFNVFGSDYAAAQSINDYGVITGQYGYLTGPGSVGPLHGFIGYPASLPAGTTAGGAYTFNLDVVPDHLFFIDPTVATGFDYEIGTGDPLFASVLLPIGIGDSIYSVLVDGMTFIVFGGQVFDFTTHGFANGVSAFRVTGIEASAGLDPTNPEAFATGLTFVSEGQFTGTMTPITAFVDEPATLILLGLGLAGLAASRKRRQK